MKVKQCTRCSSYSKEFVFQSELCSLDSKQSLFRCRWFWFSSRWPALLHIPLSECVFFFHMCFWSLSRDREGGGRDETENPGGVTSTHTDNFISFHFTHSRSSDWLIDWLTGLLINWMCSWLILGWMMKSVYIPEWLLLFRCQVYITVHPPSQKHIMNYSGFNILHLQFIQLNFIMSADKTKIMLFPNSRKQ